MDTNQKTTNDVPAEVPTQEEKTPKAWGRRELLKALAATGGAVALSNVPNKWNKPEVGFGVLPAHAQASNNNGALPQPPPAPTYALFCDSQPGGGNYDVAPHNGTISDIRPRLVLTSGSGSVENVTATMTISLLTGSATFNPVPPRIAVTDALGIADFGSLVVSGDNSSTSFNLIFTFAVPGGPATIQCGLFQHS